MTAVYISLGILGLIVLALVFSVLGMYKLLEDLENNTEYFAHNVLSELSDAAEVDARLAAELDEVMESMCNIDEHAVTEAHRLAARARRQAFLGLEDTQDA